MSTDPFADIPNADDQHPDDIPEDGQPYFPRIHHDHVLAGHLVAERRNLQDAHQWAVDGPPNPGPVQSDLPSRVRADPTVTNQFYRNSVGSPHHAGAGARADNPNVELLAPGWHSNRRPRESMTVEGRSAEEFLGRRPALVTSTRVRPSDYPDGEEYEYGDSR